MKVLVLDNYDSFTYNLVHILREFKVHLQVYRNDEISIEDASYFDKILLSPGPGLPSQAGIMPQLLEELKGEKSIMGVCLGHQCIGESYGAQLRNLSTVYHGIVTEVMQENDDALFEGIDNTFKACRYHSWVIDEKEVPEDVIVTSRDAHGTIMSIKHKTDNVRGVQFHPESVMSEHGKKMIENWLAL